MNQESKTAATSLTMKPTPPLGITSIVLVLSIGAMLALWSLASIAYAHPSQQRMLTERGRKYFLPEYDLHVYVIGTVSAVILAVTAGLLWRRRMQTDPERMKRLDRSLLLTQFNCLLCLFILRLARLPLWFCVLSSVSMGTGTWFVFLKTGKQRAIAQQRDSHRAWKFGWKLRVAFDVLAISSMAFYCIVPKIHDLRFCVEMIDANHHWDHYLMAPALAFRHGKSLGTEVYSQYGVGWPMLFSALSSHSAVLDYNLALEIAAVAMFFYFIGLYYFLRAWLKSCAWALAGTWLAFGLQVFFGGGNGLMMYPSSTILRYGMDVACFAALLGYNRSQRKLFAILAGIAAGLSILLGTDTGIQLTAAVGCYAVGCALARPSKRLMTSTAWGACSWLAIVLLGLAVASRGTLLSTQFWRGWTEPLWIYGAGLGSLPIRNFGWSNSGVATLVTVLFVYLFVLCRMILRLLQRTETYDGILRATIATYGLGIFMLFITRSDPLNLYHPIVPCSILLTVEACRYARLYGRSHPLVGSLASPVALALSSGLLLVGQYGRPHPGLLDQATVATAKRIAGATPPSYRVADRARWQSVISDLRKWRLEGKKVALLGTRETWSLVAADIPPYWKFSPLCEELCLWDQVEELRAALRTRPPDVAVIPVTGCTNPIDHEVLEALRAELKQSFRHERTANELEVYFKR